MKLLLLLIVLVCAVVAVWYFRDDITGEKLRFGYREEAGARFKAPKWRESVRDGNPTEGRLILKHEKHDDRIFYLAWRFGKTPPDLNERTAATKAFSRALGKMAGFAVSVGPRGEKVEMGERQAVMYVLKADGKARVGELCMWYFAPNKQRWFFAILDDDLDERGRITTEFFDSFTPGRSTIQYDTTTEGKLAFDAPLGWSVFDENPRQVLYVSPQEEVLVQLHHGTRTSRARMTKQYAAALTGQMIEAAGGTWKSREYAIGRDARLKTAVARVRGVALIEYTEQHYEVRLWISPETRLLYVAALSAEDKKKFEKFTAIFDRITSED